MEKFFLLFFLLQIFSINSILPNNHFEFSTNDLSYLSELPLDKLLKVKKSLKEISCIINENNNRKIILPLPSEQIASDRILGLKLWNNQSTHPQASPLKDMSQHYDVLKKSYMPEDTKQSKVQSFFQLSITALAFFAFGGYLLCMIVQAIKSKGTTYYHPAAYPMTNPTNLAVKKRRPSSFGKRRKRGIQTMTNSTTTIITGEPSPDQLYHALVLFAENYVHYQKI